MSIHTSDENANIEAPEWLKQMPPIDEEPPGGDDFDGTHLHQPAKEYPVMRDAWDTSRDTVQGKSDDFDPSSFVGPITRPTESALVPVETEESDQDSTERQYITTHTPHAWLDRYIEYSRELSPRGFDALHEASGLWAMSATVAGRVTMNFGGRLRHTSLQIAAVARSSVWVKSHTIGLAERLLHDAGLSWRLLPTKASPQAIIEEMSDSNEILEIIRALETEEDEKIIKKLQKRLDFLKDQLGRLYAHEGQRAWYLSEFGTKIIAGMMRPGSALADFSDFLRDINEKVSRDYEYRTRGHGKENISSPCLSIIADTTPADIRPYARAGAPLWSNGFFPRFAIIAPLVTDVPSLAQVAYEAQYQTVAPYELTSVMVEVDKRLGGRADYDERLPLQPMHYSRYIHQEIYKYEKWIIANRLDTEDLDGTYKRLVFEQSVSIATLLAVFDNSLEVLPRHYQRAMEICETFRQCTEDFYLRMTESAMSEKDIEKSQKEDKILRIIGKFHKKNGTWPTLREIRKQTGSKSYRMSNEDIGKILDVLKDSNLIEEFKEQRARAYRYKLT